MEPMEIRHTNQSFTDKWLGRLDDARRMLSETSAAPRPSPAASQPEDCLTPQSKRISSGLMRVNHAGEICAQGLYAGQALLARSSKVRQRMLEAAAEEQDHLVWCQLRLNELGAKPSTLTPLWMLASVGLGATMALGGDKFSLGFLAETEAQVGAHLERHIERLPEEDHRSAAILGKMREEEAAHGDAAQIAGGMPLAPPIQKLMNLASQVMVKISYYI